MQGLFGGRFDEGAVTHDDYKIEREKNVLIIKKCFLKTNEEEKTLLEIVS